MPIEQYPLIFLHKKNETLDFTSPQSSRSTENLPERERIPHAEGLTNKFQKIWDEQNDLREERTAISLSSREGHYIEFKGGLGYDLTTKSLENLPKGIRLLNVRQIIEDEQPVTIATVYVPSGKESHFIARLNEYLDVEKDSSKNKPKNHKLVDSIEDVKTAILESFWQDDLTLIPGNANEWCELWLRQENGVDVYNLFITLCATLEIEFKNSSIAFPERLVVLAKVNRNNLIELIKSFDFLAEFRKAREHVGHFLDLSNFEQMEWVEDLEGRLDIQENLNTSICLLDTGVNNGHQLIAPVLSDEDLHTYEEEWGVNDLVGHGTRMAGIAIYGDLKIALQDTGAIALQHMVESGKILPPNGQNSPELYGHITSRVISLAEIAKPDRKRILCMAVSIQGDFDRGRPSSYSGAIDSITSGANDEIRRLIILSAGNVVGSWSEYPEINEVSSIESPGQAWNAITVGAYTKLTDLSEAQLDGFEAIAPADGLSPYSTTSIVWDKKKWPLKPDIVLEGGNVARDSENFTTEVDALSVLSTHHRPTEAQFDSFRMTSAATAHAAWMAAKIQSKYINIWPETVRALLIHSASWSETMKEQFFKGNTEKIGYHNLLRTCGYGIPNLEKALYCLSNNLTLVAEAEIQPFQKKKHNKSTTYASKDMHFYELPWPSEALLDLGNTPVTMRVTLSYFIEPGPGEIGWKDRYRYRSHGLKFDVNRVGESQEDFKKRVNKAAREEDDTGNISKDGGNWKIGSQNRNLGSVHSDFIVSTGAELSTCNFIGVFPLIGWWKQRAHLGRVNKKTRYSIVISLETQALEVDLYNPVIVKLAAEIEV